MSLRLSGMGLLFAVGFTAFGLGAGGCDSGATTQGGTGPGGGGQGSGSTSTSGVTSGPGATSTSGVTSGPGATTSAGSTSATTTSSSTTTGGGNTCDLLPPDSCADCVEAKCCAELLVCKNDAACMACVLSFGGAGCESNKAFAKVASCAMASCGPVLAPDPSMEGPDTITSNPCHFAPAAWTCDPALYDQQHKTPGGPVVCNCECGPYLDPDCTPAAPSSCGANAFCTLHCGCVPNGSACQ